MTAMSIPVSIKVLTIATFLAVVNQVTLQAPVPGSAQTPTVQMFPAKGVVTGLKPDGRTLIIRHEPIGDYMDAMTMPFKVSNNRELTAIQVGDEIVFRLLVTDTNSWIDQIKFVAKSPTVEPHASERAAEEIRPARPNHPLMDYPFTNELGQAVRLSDFRGQALAITFFFTRCPIPDYCPRLSRNFEEASRKLLAASNAPVNWHFLSVSFDPDFDTPEVLAAYAKRYHADSRHWSFLTGPVNTITELATQSDVQFQRDGGFFDHNFRTLIIDAAGRLQMSYPIGGDISDAIVSEIIRAASAKAPPQMPSSPLP
jgi:protein SCO1/2